MGNIFKSGLRSRFGRMLDRLRWGYVADGPQCIAEGRALGRGAVLRLDGGNIFLGEHVELKDECLIVAGEDCTSRIGCGTRMQRRGMVLGDVTIGNQCLFGPNFYASSGDHLVDECFGLPPILSEAPPDSRRSVIIGDGVWMGINVFVAAGVTVGRGCVVGANSVVTSDLPAYSVCVGAPCRPIRYLAVEYWWLETLITGFKVSLEHGIARPSFYLDGFLVLNESFSDSRTVEVAVGPDLVNIYLFELVQRCSVVEKPLEIFRVSIRGTALWESEDV